MPDRWHPSIAVDPQPITTAAATTLAQLPAVTRDLFQYSSWQDEAWDYWRSLGELNQAITWLSNSLSRVRLMAAEVVPGGDEPEMLDDGPAADLMQAFAGGTPGQAVLMAALGTQLGVPAEGWLVAERDSTRIPLSQADWKVVPTSSLRPPQGNRGVQIRIGENRWRPLADEGMATKIFKEDPQFPWRAFSPVQAALPILRRIDLVDRRIVAVMVSRLVLNGLLIIPQEGTFTVPKQYKDAADPFYAQLIEAGQNAIARPGTASAALPLIVKYAAEFIDKWRLLKWEDVLPAELLDERDREIKRLAITLNLPTEWLTGMGDVKFWNAFHLTEEAISLYVVPYAETICDGITKGYLYPLLKQMGQEPIGPNGGKIVVWYDTSELTARPDKSVQAVQAYDRLELGGTALRREIGLDEADMPDTAELKSMVLKRISANPQTAFAALQALVGGDQIPAPGGASNGSVDTAGRPVTPPRQLSTGDEGVTTRLGRRPRPHPVNTR